MTTIDEQSEFERRARELLPELELLRLVGEGSVAHVYLAREPALKRPVAVKILNDALVSGGTARQRFEREAQAAASIKHPNVAVVHRVGWLSTGVPYIVMEYIKGRTLADIIRARGPIALEDSRRILAALASALSTAHRKGVVHRDIRPGNVIWEDESDRIVLVDFGIAALLDDDAPTSPRLTTAGHRVGDLLHMSPEQMRGEAVVPESDVYALGVLGYEILTGEPPWSSPLTRHRPPRPLAAAVQGAPHIGELLQRCLADQPQQRPRASDVFEALVREPGQKATAALSESGAPAGALSEFLYELKRRKVYRVAVAYVAAAFIGLQGVQLVMPALPVADGGGLYRVIVALTAAGFPIALVLSWAFDLTTTGIRWSSRSHRSTHWFPVMALLLSIALAAWAWFAVAG